MIYSLPIQERRAFISKHNREADREEQEFKKQSGDANVRTFEGEAINTYAGLSQSNQNGGR